MATSHTLSLPLADTCYCILRLCRQQLLRDKVFFESFPVTLHVTPSTAKPTFLALYDDILKDSLNWGRIIMSILVASNFANYLYDKYHIEAHADVEAWLVARFSCNVIDWIRAHGGWSTVSYDRFHFPYVQLGFLCYTLAICFLLMAMISSRP